MVGLIYKKHTQFLVRGHVKNHTRVNIKASRRDNILPKTQLYYRLRNHNTVFSKCTRFVYNSLPASRFKS